MPLRDMDREQMWMLPPTLDELLPLDHPARFLAEFVDALDREELEVEIDGEALGAPAYHPRALLSVWLYGFMTGSAFVPEAGGGLPGPDIVPVADRVAASGPQHLVEVLQRASAGYEEAVRADGSYGGDDEVGGPGGSGGGWHEGGRHRLAEQELRRRGTARAAWTELERAIDGP